MPEYLILTMTDVYVPHVYHDLDFFVFQSDRRRDGGANGSDNWNRHNDRGHHQDRRDNTYDNRNRDRYQVFVGLLNWYQVFVWPFWLISGFCSAFLSDAKFLFGLLNWCQVFVWPFWLIPSFCSAFLFDSKFLIKSKLQQNRSQFFN